MYLLPRPNFYSFYDFVLTSWSTYVTGVIWAATVCYGAVILMFVFIFRAQMRNLYSDYDFDPIKMLQFMNLVSAN